MTLIKLSSNLFHTHLYKLTFLAGLASLILGLISTGQTLTINSDYVGQQTILTQWERGYHYLAITGQDSFILKFPLYFITEQVLSPSRLTLIVETLILNAVGFTAFFFAAKYFWRKLNLRSNLMFFLSIVWVANLSTSLMAVVWNPNTRNIELGLAFFILMLFSKFLDGELVLGRLKLLLMPVLALATALFIYNDPYFLFVILAPLTLLLLLENRNRHRQVQLLAFIAVSTVLFELLVKLFQYLGFYPSQITLYFTALPQLTANFALLVQSILDLFHANFFGSPVMSATSIRQSTNFLLLTLTFISTLIYLFKARFGHLTTDLWKTLFLLVPFWTAALFLATSYTIDGGASRYLVIIPFFAPFILSLLYQQTSLTRLKFALPILLAISLAWTNFSALHTLTKPHPDPNADNAALIERVQSLSLTKGYTDYWSADINTYFSGNRTDFIQVLCHDNQLIPHTWLGDNAIYGLPATRSFYLQVTDSPQTNSCNNQDLQNQFGRPDQVVKLDFHQNLFIYTYDIGEKIRNK